MITSIILLIITIFLSGFFSGAEVAFLSLSELKIRHLAQTKVKNAQTLLKLKKEMDQTLITILIGNNIANIGGSAIATKLAIDLFSDAGVGIATGIMTLITLTFGEITPKNFAARNAKKISLGIAPIIYFLRRILSPFVWAFHKFSLLLAKDGEKEPLVTERELRHMVNVGESEGEIKPEEKEMLQKVFSLDEKTAKDIMKKRQQIYALEEDKTLKETIKQIKKQNYSRIPLYHKTLDKITGMLLVKDLIDEKDHNKKLKEFKRKLPFISPDKDIDKLLKKLQQKKVHMAIIKDKKHATIGLITIEDVLEEIVGELFDESDHVKRLITKRTKNSWIILGKTPIKEINKELNLNLEMTSPTATLASFLRAKAIDKPKEGLSIRTKKPNMLFIIQKMEGHTILEVLVRKVIKNN